MQDYKGFTLLEVLIVVIIIGILASIALPQYLTTLEKARTAEAFNQISTLRSAMDRYWFEQSALQTSYTTANLNKLDVDSPMNNSQRLYNYTLTDGSTLTVKNYSINATRINKTDYWIKWEQTNSSGKMYKSSTLGGPES